mmetsp:Transcript_21566/g.30473  ORF Transcript_21566/g.30473 Transcript_21566/m.30473 type:complete len:208 (-) Transcript_21566:958-1581(-)
MLRATWGAAPLGGAGLILAGSTPRSWWNAWPKTVGATKENRSISGCSALACATGRAKSSLALIRSIRMVGAMLMFWLLVRVNTISTNASRTSANITALHWVASAAKLQGKFAKSRSHRGKRAEDIFMFNCCRARAWDNNSDVEALRRKEAVLLAASPPFGPTSATTPVPIAFRAGLQALAASSLSSTETAVSFCWRAVACTSLARVA